MTANDRWFLPQGMEDLLPPDADRLEALRRRLLDLFQSWGYGLVMPPVAEYQETLLIGAGADLDLQTFKLVDQLNGRTLALRADITPQIARIDNRILAEEGPTRYCYQGTTFHTRGDGLGGTRSPLQIGAELFGHAGVEADVEVVLLMLEALESAEIAGVHLDLGHVGIFRALADAAGLDREQESALFDALQRKACAEIEAQLEALDVPDKLHAMLAALPELNGAEEVLAQARSVLADGPRQARAALDELAAIAEVVRARRPELVIYFDLAELRSYHYHTGPVYAAFLPGEGEALARGGRYDQLSTPFGRQRPATGFSADLKKLMQLSAMPSASQAPIMAPASDDPTLAEAVRALRAEGECVVQQLGEQDNDNVNTGRRLECVDGQWRVTAI